MQRLKVPPLTALPGIDEYPTGEQRDRHQRVTTGHEADPGDDCNASPGAA